MIIRCLDTSTRALTRRDVELLETPLNNPIFSYHYEYGAFITGPDLSERDPGMLADFAVVAREFGYSDSMLKLLAYCRDHDIQLIRIDADGDDDLCDGTALDHHDW